MFSTVHFFIVCCILHLFFSSGAKTIPDNVDCKKAMAMVQTYLRVSKVELIKHIKQAKEQACNAQAWRKVEPSMIAHTHVSGAKYEFKGDSRTGLRIKVTVTNKACGQSGSHFVTHIKGPWTQIMYTQRFTGSAKCWSIFGKERTNTHKENAGLETFSRSLGDITFGEVNMGSKTDHAFDGRCHRCDDKDTNFWHTKNGQGERKVTVMLRRKPSATHAGISTDTSCGTPTYYIDNIFVLM